jgi:hypothetical protein
VHRCAAEAAGVGRRVATGAVADNCREGCVPGAGLRPDGYEIALTDDTVGDGV